MIAPGTLCLIVPDHCMAGRTCTVIGPAQEPYELLHAGVWHKDYYRIDIPGAVTEKSDLCGGWGALPRQLVPLGDPSLLDKTAEEKDLRMDSLVRADRTLVERLARAEAGFRADVAVLHAITVARLRGRR